MKSHVDKMGQVHMVDVDLKPLFPDTFIKLFMRSWSFLMLSNREAKKQLKKPASQVPKFAGMEAGADYRNTKSTPQFDVDRNPRHQNNPADIY
jgi:hypothetical protein